VILIEDSKIMDLTKQPKAFMTSYIRTREKFGAVLYGSAVQGFDVAKYRGKAFDIKSADGVTLFHKAHPPKVSGKKQSNLFADPFSASALGKMETLMQNFCGDNEEILDVAPDTILIPSVASLKESVFAAIGSDKDPNTANNAYNYQYGR